MIAKEPRPGPPMSGSNKSGGISEALMTATATRFVLCNAPLFSVFLLLRQLAQLLRHRRVDHYKEHQGARRRKGIGKADAEKGLSSAAINDPVAKARSDGRRHLADELACLECREQRLFLKAAATHSENHATLCGLFQDGAFAYLQQKIVG